MSEENLELRNGMVYVIIFVTEQSKQKGYLKK
jgi:hypothetical protein